MSELLHVLLVEDNPGDADLIKELLSCSTPARYEIECMSRLAAALERVKSGRFDIILLDLGLPDSAGLDTVRAMRRQAANIPIVVLTGNDDEQTGIAAIKEGAQDYLVKGQIGEKLFVRLINYAIERKRGEDRIRQINEELEKRVIERTMELENINRELESFSYSISHDLHAPLRAISGFLEIIYEDYTDKLDEKGKDYINRIAAATKRMTQLIDALLTLSHLSRSEMKKVNINLSKTAKAIVKELAFNYPERHVNFICVDDVFVFADEALIRTALCNLLNNAWKYTNKRELACVELGMIEKDGNSIYFVRDDGVGFNMKYVDKLFIPFQRLHSKSDFEGDGIGLATVSRIVKRHGGEIWVNSAEGKGSIFYFTLGLV